MANTIKIKNSGNTNSVPSTLEFGELALNYADGKIYYKNNSNVIANISSSASSTDPEIRNDRIRFLMEVI